MIKILLEQNYKLYWEVIMGRTLSAMPLTILNGKDYVFRDENFWMLAEIETHPEVMRWNIEVYTSDKNEMYRAFKDRLKNSMRKRIRYFLLGCRMVRSSVLLVFNGKTEA
jgi:hypothetical protein